MEFIWYTLTVIGVIYFVFFIFIYLPTIDNFKTDQEVEGSKWVRENKHQIRGL